MENPPSSRVIRITIPGRPTRWERPKQTKTGRRYNSPEAEAAKRAIAHEIAGAWSGPPHLGPARISGVFIFDIPASWPPRTRAACLEGRVDHIADPDLDQLLKLVMDACSGIVVADDNQFSRFGRSAKRYGTPARTEIVIELLESPQDAMTPGQKRLVKAWADGPPAPRTPQRGRGSNPSGMKFRRRR